MPKIIQTTIALTSKYNRAGWPSWLSTKSDDEVDSYFAEHPSSKYNPFNFSDEESDEDNDDTEEQEDEQEEKKEKEKEEKEQREEKEAQEEQDEAEEDLEQHKLPLHRRLTFNGWHKSAPVKQLRQRLQQYEDMADDVALDRLDLMDEIKELKDAQADDKELKSEIDSPRRKKRITRRIAKRGEKIAKLRDKVQRCAKRGSVMRKRIKMLKAEMKKRGKT